MDKMKMWHCWWVVYCWHDVRDGWLGQDRRLRRYPGGYMEAMERARFMLAPGDPAGAGWRSCQCCWACLPATLRAGRFHPDGRLHLPLSACRADADADVHEERLPWPVVSGLAAVGAGLSAWMPAPASTGNTPDVSSFPTRFCAGALHRFLCLLPGDVIGVTARSPEATKCRVLHLIPIPDNPDSRAVTGMPESVPRAPPSS